MMELPGYSIGELLQRGTDHVVCRATRERDGRPVVVKMPATQLPSPGVLARLQHEFEVTHGRNLDGVIHALALERIGSNWALVVEDYGAISLAKCVDGGMDIDAIFQIARGLTLGLRGVHSAGFIHKDIKPANIVVSKDLSSVWLVDFGIATEFSHSTQHTSPAQIEGTLSYMAPEQTGRMNRPVDVRSDLYSVGVTLYELLTGTLPFTTCDSLELVHQHVAKVPDSPCRLRPDAPKPLCQLVLRLLKKDAEARYQSAHGLLFDLDLCLQAFRAGESDVTLGTRDVADEFRIPHQLYGRDAELIDLDAAMNRLVRGGVELLQVTGPSGIGKSVLVGEVVRLSTLVEATHVRGKFEQYAHDVPYLAIREAFCSLARRLLSEPEQRLQLWRSKILKAVGDNGILLTQLVPELELVLGPQPDVPRLALTETESRFNLVMRRFIRAIASQERPLVLFLDDIQWADGASLSLMQTLLTDVELTHFLLIVAYREGEVGKSHPYRAMLEQLGGTARASSPPICPGPLRLDAVAYMVAETLNAPVESVTTLAALVAEKTAGNPFFVNEFLRELYRKDLVVFDAERLVWTWDEQAIQDERITENVVDLVVGRLGELEQDTRQVVKLAAVAGHRFTLATLASVSQRTPEQVAESLKAAIAANVITPIGDDFKYRALQADRAAEIAYVFVHDRVHQAAYSTIPEADRIAMHKRIGERLLESEDTVDEALFVLVNHLNEALELWVTPEERARVADLNLRACRKANSSRAYAAARRYANNGLQLLGPQCWSSHESLTRGLTFESLKMAFLLGDYEQIAPLHKELIERGRGVHDHALATEILVQYLVSTMQYESALDVGLPILCELGVVLPRRANKLQVIAGMMATMWQLHGQSVEGLADLPKMTDRTLLIAMRLLVTLSAPAYTSEPDLFPQMVFSIVQHSVRHGNAPGSAFGYVCFGLAQCSVLGRYDEGYRFGLLALEMIREPSAYEFEAKVRFLHGLFIQPWTVPITETLRPFQLGATRGLETGDLEYYSYNFWGLASHQLLLGQDLDRLADTSAAHHEAILAQSQEKVSLLLLIVRDLVAFLRADAPIRVGELDEARVLALSQERGDKTSVGYCHTFRCMRRYLAHDFASVIASAAQCRVVQEGLDGQIFVPIYQFYESLAQLALARDGRGRPTRVAGNQRRLHTVANRVPETFLAKWHMVEGERAANARSLKAALQHFEKALDLARAQENYHDLALTHRLTAACLQRADLTASAVFHDVEAGRAWLAWGAIRLAPGGRLLTRDTNQPPITNEASMLDLESIVRAAQAIAHQMRPADLAKEVLSVALSSAGATSGLLVLRGVDGQHAVHAMGTIGKSVTLVEPPMPMAKAPVPAYILRLAVRTGEAVVVDDVQTDERLRDERALIERSAKSLLAVPMRLQGEVRGVILLLNNLVKGAFTPSRSQFIEVIASQAAISLQNSLLYRNLEHTLEVQTRLTNAHARFVPHQFLAALGREHIQDVELGDSASKELSVVFSDIREFTPLIERLGPEKSIRFINSFLRHMEPSILKHGGFVDNYIGDAVMALFDDPVDGAVAAGVDMLRALERFNEVRLRDGAAPVQIGVGINTGPLMLGTIGGPSRMKCSVIGDTVNLAARVESLTKQLGVPMLIGEDTFSRLRDPSRFRIRPVDRVRVVGRTDPVTLYEVFDTNPEPLRHAKLESIATYGLGLKAYYERRFDDAVHCFTECTTPGDVRVEAFLRRATELAARDPGPDWDGVLTMTRK